MSIDDDAPRKELASSKKKHVSAKDFVNQKSRVFCLLGCAVLGEYDLKTWKRVF